MRDSPECDVTTASYAFADDLRNGSLGGGDPFDDNGLLDDLASPQEACPAPAPDLSRRVLLALGLDPLVVQEAINAASRYGTDLAAELVAAGAVSEAALAEAFAEALSVPFERLRPDDRILGASTFHGRPTPRLIRTCSDRLDVKAFILPRLESLDQIARLLAARPSLRPFVRITTPSDIRAAIDRQTSRERQAAAVLSLSATQPELSARRVMTAPQAAALILAASLMAAALTHIPWLVLRLLHAVAAILFGACLAFRFAAIAGPRPMERLDQPEVADEPLPVYSVLVALHHETTVVPKLVAALSRLDWPASRLEIKLICEADDFETIRIVERAIAGRPQFDIVLVPPCEPRTKPKALNYALPLVAGEFVVLYDAEDEPDPGQLREAYRAFRSGPGDLACLQAPLVIRNGDRNWLTGLFALEYALLFRRFLPWLARHRMPLPLGGTSNHFVRTRLIEAGGWDSHNVTEDADLGLRLARKGHTIGTITRPTFEDAPECLGIWTKQRTRWMKGWLQTYLLHMRSPRRLQAELGLKGVATFHLLFLGMLAPALAHPVFMVIVAVMVGRLISGAITIETAGPLLALDLFNAAGGYSMFVLLSASALDRRERRSLPWFYVFLPIYWVMIAVATLRAIAQLFVTPHKWEKTPHGLESRMDAGDHRYRVEPNFDGLAENLRQAGYRLQHMGENEGRRPVGAEQ